MYIHQVAAYLPDYVVTNEHFTRLNGLASDWIIERTGIRERRKAGPGENTNTMAIEATRRALAQAPTFPASSVDLIVGATYTPHDTIYTLAHAVQRELGVNEIPVVSISSACSSLLNAVEIVEGYFATGKASRAVVVVSEHNTAYNNEQDTMAGHLWGDGASTLLISKERISPSDLRIVEVITGGAAVVGKADEAVTLKPVEKGIVMPHGRDVFTHACTYMARVTEQLLERQHLAVADVTYLIPHQANLRITKNVVKQLGMAPERAVSNIEQLGNTGCAGAAIGLGDTWNQLVEGNRVVITVFGGGYSYGAMLLER
ncbi:ketoacyl-ACP synthase III [Hymenobacter sp. BT186]|uniref:Ketoacyl-ACP synthase III n=1 Tax=Hymenobacter telluris TaxID=2816474 RepID=A0A939JDG0_9BACT|nr:ketoacyl-ACP synthase III [Hymenobacter telluris]MBO0358317.1 ketoacyl-ACP synthase III [Hymenobacter telluris]MBW3374343.1 ketoacyl-ACP synthase III [Hymenobacter norwichensis]